MKVKELIKKLHKMPQNAEVAWKDHDQYEGELNGFVKQVELVDFSKIQLNMWDLDEEVVVLRS